jgi:kynurenine formamidase
MPLNPPEKEVLGWFDQLSNWGRWGKEDELGTLNHITPQVRKAAAECIRHGESISCAWDLSNVPQADDLFGTPQRFMLATGEGLDDEHRVVNLPHFPPEAQTKKLRMYGAIEYIGFVFHGSNITHIDAPSHFFWDRQMYNGRPSELVCCLGGATANAVTAARNGITSRGVLLDIPTGRGVPWLEPGEGVYPEDLEAAEARQGVKVRPGDIVLLRTGYGRRKREVGPVPQSVGHPGWHASALPWLYERNVAMIGCDTNTDAIPSGYQEVPIPVHLIGLTSMGLWLLDNCDFELLAKTAERLQQWEFLLSVLPLRIAGGTGSPVNPIATF